MVCAEARHPSIVPSGSVWSKVVDAIGALATLREEDGNGAEDPSVE